MLADIQTTSNDSLEFIVDDDEAGYGWVGEVDSRPNTDTPRIGKQIIPVMEVYANPKATQKMLDDAGFDAESWLVRKLSDRFSRAENTAFVLGNSPKQPKGFNVYADAADVDTYEYGKIGTMESTVNNSFSGIDLITLQGHLKEGYQSNAKWLMHRQTFSAVSTLVDDQNRFLFQNYLSMEGKPTMLLLGKEVVFGSDMPLVGDDTLPIAYADWSQAYVIVDRYGIRVLRDPYSTKGSVEFYSTKRVGGDVSNFDAIKRLRIQ
jgi:HK97 family phage major capsid protein